MSKSKYKWRIPQPTIFPNKELPKFDKDFRTKNLNSEYYCAYPDHCIHYGRGSINAFNISACVTCGFRLKEKETSTP